MVYQGQQKQSHHSALVGRKLQNLWPVYYHNFKVLLEPKLSGQYSYQIVKQIITPSTALVYECNVEIVSTTQGGAFQSGTFKDMIEACIKH